VRGLKRRGLDSFEMKSIDWLDKPLFQRGAFHLIAGEKGTGKGTFTCGLAARVSRGDLFGEPKSVLLVSSEDSAAIDIKPRVRAAGGDESRIHVIVGSFQLPSDIAALKQTIRDIEDVGLLIIDPLGNHVGGRDTDKEGVVRDAIGPLNAVADEFGLLLLGIRHLNKDVSRGALASVLGSTAWVYVPRCVLLMAADDEDDALFHIQVVAGNRGPRGEGRSFHIELADVGLKEPVTLAVDRGTSNKNVETLLEKSASGSRSGNARNLILDVLADVDHMESDAVDARVAQETGVAAKTVKNLRSQLKNDGLLAVYPDKDEYGAVVRWNVRLTNAVPHPDLALAVNGNARG
jgi:DNA repair protein RadA/Sms